VYVLEQSYIDTTLCVF